MRTKEKYLAYKEYAQVDWFPITTTFHTVTFDDKIFIFYTVFSENKHKEHKIVVGNFPLVPFDSPW